MSRTGYASLPLHGGKAPPWLTGRMRRLGKEVSAIIVNEYGSEKFLEKLSDPFWFQAFGCVLGYDWHSSGVTTVVTGILKTALTAEEHGVVVCGGKGKTSKKTPDDIFRSGEKFGFSDDHIARLTHTSKMTAKVDNTAIQAGYQLYHHAFFITEKGKWAVVQQGMNSVDRSARRYHWLSDKTSSFIIEPHSAIVCNRKHLNVLNMTSKDSEGSRKASVDLSKEPTRKLMHIAQEVILPVEKHQTSLQKWLRPTTEDQSEISTLNMPRNINWNALAEAYEFQPSDYEQLLGIKGVGPATVRGLALIAELVYGEKPSWKDPVKYSFAYGGKDGVPYPVNREAMDESIQILKETVRAARIGDREKTRALQGLRRHVPADEKDFRLTSTSENWIGRNE